MYVQQAYIYIIHNIYIYIHTYTVNKYIYTQYVYIYIYTVKKNIYIFIQQIYIYIYTTNIYIYIFAYVSLLLS